MIFIPVDKENPLPLKFIYHTFTARSDEDALVHLQERFPDNDLPEQITTCWKRRQTYFYPIDIVRDI